MTTPSISRCQDVAQQMVTALLHGDRDLAGDLAEAFEDPLGLALVLAELAAYVHHVWSEAARVDRSGSWKFILTEVENWRLKNGPRPP